MTEYDYSPDAHERYIAKRHAITRWVSNTNRYEPANPFLPSEPSGSPHLAEARDLVGRDDQEPGVEDDYFSPPRHDYHRDERNRHQRPHSDRYDSQHSRSSRHHSYSSSSRPSRHYTSHSRQPSQSSPVPRQYSSPGGGQQNYYYNLTTHDTHGSPSRTPLSSPQPRTPYEQSSNMLTLVPLRGGADGYVLVPPKGTSYQLVQQPQSPPPIEPWFKRMFYSPSNESTGPKASKSSSGGGHGRRGSQWNWDIA